MSQCHRSTGNTQWSKTFDLRRQNLAELSQYCPAESNLTQNGQRHLTWGDKILRNLRNTAQPSPILLIPIFCGIPSHWQRVLANIPNLLSCQKWEHIYRVVGGRSKYRSTFVIDTRAWMELRRGSHTRKKFKMEIDSTNLLWAATFAKIDPIHLVYYNGW